MPRKQIIKQSEFAYHVYNRSIDKKFFNVPMYKLWEIFCQEAYAMSVIWNARIHAAVLMGNHFHMLLSTPDSNIGACMCDFQSELARGISILKGTDGYRFSSRYKWSIIKTPAHFATMVRYIYQNPVRAGIVSQAEHYPYSTLRGLLGYESHKIPLWVHPMGVEYQEKPACDWLQQINLRFSKSESRAIWRGLCKSEFKIAESRLSTSSRKHVNGKKNQF